MARIVFSAIEDVRAEAEEYRELDDERVLVLTRLSGRGRTSGVHTYFDRDRALADLGLQE